MQSPKLPSPTPPRTNQNWPEGYGFRIGGNAPVIITDIFENSYAQKSGLRPGDQLLEVDGVNVQGLSKDDVTALARQSKRVPPALCVISRIRTFTLRRRRGTFGFKVRGGGPVFVSQLDERGPAKVAGIRLGDMLVEVNNTSVREMTFTEVDRLIHTSGSVLQLVMIAGVKSIEEIEKRNTASRFRRAREFFQEMNYYLAGEEKKKSQLVKLLNKFAKDKSIETLAKGVMKILETPIQKRLIPTIRQLIPREKRRIFTDILQENQNGTSLARSASFEGKLDGSPRSKSPDTNASKYRTWSKGNRSPTKQTPPTSPRGHTISPTSPRGHTISYRERPSSMALQNDYEQSTFQRSYSTSAAFPSRRSPEIPVGEGHTVQNLAETFRFQMNQFLTRGEQLVLKQRLKEYHKHRNARQLVSSLEPILDDREKLKMVPYLSQLLPENEQYVFDKEAQKLLSKYLQGSSSEGPDVIDVAYRVQGLRLADSPHPKNVIGGSMQGDLDLYPVKETTNSPRSNESSTVAALLTAAENTKFPGKSGNVITVEALVHSKKQEEIGEADHGSALQTSVGNKTIASNGGEPLSSKLPSISSANDELDTQQEKGEIKSRSTHSDLSSAIEDQRKYLTKQASNEVPRPPVLPSGDFVPPAPPPPPPPPPSPGMNASGNDMLPRMQLKRVNWEKLGIAGLENTVWGQLGRNDRLDQLEDFVELEQQFSSAKQNRKAPEAPKKQETIEILEPRKQYNIAILLGHLKLPHEEIKRAVLSMDETTLSEAHVKQLLLYAPDHKEIQKYKHFADDEGKLGQCDKFSMLVSKIPGYRHRLKAMLFKLHFADKLEEIKPELERVVKASQELRESKQLQQVLQLVLAFGNYMNQGNARIAGASAFRVGFLAKLSSTKTSDNKSNLLKFLVKTVDTKCPEVLDLKSELTSIPLAARVSYQMVKEEVDEVVKTMEDVKTDLEEQGSQIPENDEDKFAEIMGSFVENSKRDMETLLALHDHMQSEYTKTAKFFGEDPSMTSTEEFFGIFSTFLDQFENARLELVTQKKRKEEQAKREIEKQNRLKKKKESKFSSTSGEQLDERKETQPELSKQQENIAAKQKRFAHHSSSSESEVPASPPSGIALSYEMRKNELFKSQERLDEKRCPPPVLPKPKPKPKPKLPPANRNGALPTSPNKKATSPGSQPTNSQAMHEIANEISQIKLHNNKKNKLGKSNSSDSDSTDGNVFTKLELKRPKIPKKPFQHAKNVEINETQQTQNTKLHKLPGKSGNVDENSKTSTEEKTNGLPRQNAIYFEETDGYSKMDNDASKDETSSTPREILLNLKERGTNLMMNKKRVLQNMCWPIGCQNRESYDLEDEDPLYSTVNFATLGYDTSTNVDTHKDTLKETYKDTAEISVPECSVEAYSNPIYSPSIPNQAISRSPPRTDPSNVIQISPELGIKEVQNIVKGATSYAVGQNRDLYSLPVKERSSSDDTRTVPTSGRSTPEIKTPERNSPVKNSPVVLTPDDLYSQPIMDSPQKNSDPDKPEECEGPYAETVLFDRTPTKPLINDTAHPTFDLKPPNFKPPPPPPGGSPILKKKKNKPSPPINRNMKKVRSPKKVPLKDTETLPRDKNLAFKMKRSQSENDLSGETIFASPVSIGISQEDNNNNRHSMFVTPQEAGKLHEFFVYSDVDVGNENTVHPVRDQFGNGQTPVGNHRDNIGQYDKTSFPEIVPPPPFVTPIIDAESLVVPPPPRLPDNTSLVIRPPSPMYPPPRLCHLEKAVTHKHSDEWQEMVNRLPPPPPDLLES